MQNAAEHQERIRLMMAKAAEGLMHGDVTAWLDMFAEDGAMEFPFAPDGYPKRVEGKAALTAYLDGFPHRFRIDRVTSFVAHPVADPNLGIVEFSVEGTALSTGRPYNQSYIGVLTLRDGKIVNYRDYWNPLTGLIALGGPDALLAFGTGGNQ